MVVEDVSNDIKDKKNFPNKQHSVGHCFNCFWYLYTNLHLKILLSNGATEIAPESLSPTVLFSENFREEGKETYYTKKKSKHNSLFFC